MEQIKEKFGLLRRILRMLGLSTEDAEDIVAQVADLFARHGNSELSRITLPSECFPYHLRDDFLSAAEHSFYHVLRQAMPEEVTVCPKVSLGDLFFVASQDSAEYRAYMNKIDRKHVDFLLCDANTMRPAAGIELDDKSHTNGNRRARDEFVEEVFSTAGLPLIRIQARHTYVVSEVAALIQSHLNEDLPDPFPPQESAHPNFCPRCGGRLILRTARKGSNAGKEFLGCENFPKCRFSKAV